jgi:hypothetical protein
VGAEILTPLRETWVGEDIGAMNSDCSPSLPNAEYTK